MDLPANPFKHALAAGRPQIGLWSSLATNVTVELIAAAGFLTPVEADSRRILELGGLFVAVGSDAGLLAAASDALCARFKGPRA